jgi:hypothetical protein
MKEIPKYWESLQVNTARGDGNEEITSSGRNRVRIWLEIKVSTLGKRSETS